MLTIGLYCYALPHKLSDGQLVITCRYYDNPERRKLITMGRHLLALCATVPDPQYIHTRCYLGLTKNIEYDD